MNDDTNSLESVAEDNEDSTTQPVVENQLTAPVPEIIENAQASPPPEDNQSENIVVDSICSINGSDGSHLSSLNLDGIDLDKTFILDGYARYQSPTFDNDTQIYYVYNGSKYNPNVGTSKSGSSLSFKNSNGTWVTATDSQCRQFISAQTYYNAQATQRLTAQLDVVSNNLSNIGVCCMVNCVFTGAILTFLALNCIMKGFRRG